jgi:hypothetical protein
MRFVLQVSFPVDKFNQAVRDGSAGKKLQRIMEEIRPEAAYFCADDGNRGGFFVVDMKDTSEMPKFAEPFFLNFDATVKFLPTMTPADLQKADIDKLASKWV